MEFNDAAGDSIQLQNVSSAITDLRYNKIVAGAAAFGTLTGNPTDNTALATAFNNKADKSRLNALSEDSLVASVNAVDDHTLQFEDKNGNALFTLLLDQSTLSLSGGTSPTLAVIGGTGGLSNIADDATPQLGGDLDMNSHNIQTVTPTEMAYVHGVTSAIQTQLDGKQSTLTNPVTGTGTNNEIAFFNSSGSTLGSLTTSTYPSLTELSYLKGVTSGIQGQIDGLAAAGVSDGDKGDITVSSSGTTWTIDAGAVSLSKMANINQYQLLGRSSSGVGAPQALSTSSDFFSLAASNNYAEMRTNLSLTSLATTTPGTGVATALGNAVDGSGGLASKSYVDNRTVTQSGASSLLIGYEGSFHNVEQPAAVDTMAKYGLAKTTRINALSDDSLFASTSAPDDHTISFDNKNSSSLATIGVNQNYFTVSSGPTIDPATNLITNFWSSPILDTVFVESFVLFKAPYDLTITQIAGCTSAGTVTFNIEERAATTPNTSGTDVMTSDLVADNDQQVSTTFSNASITSGTWIAIDISAVSSTANRTYFTFTITYTH